MSEAWQAELGHLFRRESGRLTAALTRIFGARNLPLVEDVVHDALCRALDTWRFTGLPDNPSAWLMTTAKRRAIDVLRREKTARTLEPELLSLVELEGEALAVDEAFADDALRDGELRMMFCCCHARLPEETQIALVLNLLSGFSVSEIAHALFTGEAAMEKRIQRGKSVLAESGKLPEITPARVAEHVAAVHGALYLIFNEGYHGSSDRAVSREDELCFEAIRLTTLLAETAATALPATRALLALMCLSAARLPARRDPEGKLLARDDQDRRRFDEVLIRRGIAELEESAVGDRPSVWHVEAAIAYEHAIARSHAEVNYARIVTFYDILLGYKPSPVVALNRAVAVAEAEGPDAGLGAIDAIADADRLAAYPFLEAARAEMHLRAGRPAEARAHFEKAGAVARSEAERRFFDARARSCA